LIKINTYRYIEEYNSIIHANANPFKFQKTPQFNIKQLKYCSLRAKNYFADIKDSNYGLIIES